MAQHPPAEPSAPAPPPRRSSSDLLSVRAQAPRRTNPTLSDADEEADSDQAAYNAAEDPLASSIISNLELPEGSAPPDVVQGQQHQQPLAAAADQSAPQGLIDVSTPPASHAAAGTTPSVLPATASVTTPRDVLNLDFPTSGGGGVGSSSLAPPSPSRAVGDDSALDALLAAHSTSPSTSSSVAPVDTQATSLDTSASTTTGDDLEAAGGTISRPGSRGPSTRDASFGLDPEADEAHAISGRRILPNLASAAGGHHHHHSHHHSSHHARSSSSGAPLTTLPEPGLPETEATSSATGMPRLLPRRASRSSLAGPSSPDSPSQEASPPAEMQPSSTATTTTPTGSLTLAALTSSSIPLSRRLSLLAAAAAINLGLPFLNGVMLGFGEIFARAVLAPALGIAPAAINVNAPAAQGAATRGRSSNVVGRNTATVGLRNAGSASSQGAGAYAKGSEGVEVENWTVER